jgi:hypothetical protein
MKQNNQVVELAMYLLNVEPKITPLVASKVLGIERLAARIYDLRQAGVSVEKNTKRDYNGKRYTEYVVA